MSPDYEIRRLAEGDLPQLSLMIALFNQVFENGRTSSASPAHLLRLLGDSTFIAIAALSGGQVIGGLSAHILPQVYSDQPECFVYDLAVRTDCQRQGIGRRLLKALTDICHAQNIREFFVPAEAVDHEALAFYRATGGVADEVVHFTYPVAE